MNFQDWGQMAGGVTLGARPFIDHYLKNKDEDKDAKTITDAMKLATDKQQTGTSDELAQVNGNIANYKQDLDQRLIKGEAVPLIQQAEEQAAMETSRASLERKASFVDSITNEDPLRARAMYVDKLMQNGMKVDKTTLGVFDMLQKDIATGKAQLDSEDDRTLKLNQSKAQGIAVTEFFKDKPQYAPIFKALEANGVPIESAAPLLSTLIKDENSADSLINKMLLGQMNIGSREKIASENNGTKEVIAAIHNSNKSSNDEWKQITRQDKLDKIEQDRKDKAIEKQEKDAKYLLDRKSDRTANANTVLKNIPNFDKMKSDIEKKKAIDGYIKSGIVPTIKKDAKGVHYASFGTKSSPTKTDGKGDKVKEKKHDPYGLL